MSFRYRTQFMTEVGASPENVDAIGDYSSEAAIFEVRPPDGETWNIARLIISVTDSGSFDSGAYGNGITLTNGITLRVSNDDGIVYNMTPDPIITTVDWSEYCYDGRVDSFGTGNNAFFARWTFRNAGLFLQLDSRRNERLELVVNDDLTGLIQHRFLVQGHVYRTT